MRGQHRLGRLASLIRQRNSIEREISGIINRPAHSGHIGEFVAARIFDIELVESASHKGMDGHFTRGALAGKSVNIKKSSKNEGLLNITLDAPPDFYLVLSGPRTPPASSRGTVQPWTIDSVFLFDALALVEALIERSVKIGVATSVRRHLWDEAEVYPSPSNPLLQLTADQVSMIGMFGSLRSDTL